MQAHNTEVTFYMLAKKHKLDIKIPKVYFAQDLSPKSDYGGLLFMEDASETSYVIPPYEKTTLSEAKQVISTYLYSSKMNIKTFQQRSFVF